MLKSIRTINSATRNHSVDIFRAVAIILVVLYHYKRIVPFGFLGVDLFFVISGLLIGGILTNEFRRDGKIKFRSFFLRRGAKIYPSYFFYIAVITWVNSYSKPFHFSDLYKYIFFYENYTGTNTIVWSLCVEEHFYILLPILFIIISKFIPDRLQKRYLFGSILFTILAGITFKYISYQFTISQDTYSATHNRIDSLAWGVLLSLIISYYPERIYKKYIYAVTIISGLIILTGSILLADRYFLFDKIYFHSVAPFAFFLLLAGTYFLKFPSLIPLRFIAYYSYNLYLWHSLIGWIVSKYVPESRYSILIYLSLTLIVAMAITILIEEPFYKPRNKSI